MKREGLGLLGAIFGAFIVTTATYPGEGAATADFTLNAMLILSGAAVMGVGAFIAADLWLEGHQGGGEA